MARVFLLFLLLASVRADSVEDAARLLAQRVAPRLAANETAQVTLRNLTSLARADAARAQAAFERALRRRVRNPVPVAIALTISQNLKGYLFIADLARDSGHIVAMEPYHPDPAAPAARPALTLGRKLLWQQPAPILDLLLRNDQMLVLDTAGLTRYQRRDGQWTAAESAPAPAAVRDPRGRILLDQDSLTIDLPGQTCRGQANPLELACEPGAVFSAGRNTFAGPPPFLSEARAANARVFVDADGQARINDTAIENWGSDISTFPSCAGARLAVTSSSDRESPDSITLYDLIQTVPIRVSDPADFPGPVTALWPRPDGALAVVHNLANHFYEAYGLTADCGR